ncbi:AI-2E family transporter [Aureimonas fodinaquatilis]|uniref:AI-2E family transporter n=1 Tax=Aureimonas fodinaquatilis TaxID=2565783 RepID=A0A5B0DUV2_9HYPH|nr:AI-2E family transporter [Aureimonas fodinaquatilis]KAA0970118.1 AI-2E family transporter [Aureimonas fodinaquatilis]
MSGPVQPPERKTVVAPNIGLVTKQTVQVGPRWAVIGIFLILLGGALYLTASFLLPVVFAILFALVLSPIVRFARRRLRIPEPITAIVLVVGTLVGFTAMFYALSDPMTQIVRNAPTYAQAVDDEISEVRRRFNQLTRARHAVQEQTEVAVDVPQEDVPQEVIVRSPSLLDSAATTAPQMLAGIAFALIFLFFLLASGDLFHSKLVQTMPTFSDKKKALSIAHAIEKELSRYLFTITLINICLGFAIGFVLWLVNMPTPAVFGALAAILNFVPYIGAIVGLGLVGVVALAEFGDVTTALIPVVLYFACTSIEGQFITPLVVGRRLEMNAAAVFLSVAFWGWIWGITGMFLAVPIMVGVKILASYVDGMQSFGNFLASDSSPNTQDDTS